MPVIYIYGASGSGTSTLGRTLQTQYQYHHLDTDDYFWMPTDPPFTLKRPAAERVALLKEDIGKSCKTVVSGSLCGWAIHAERFLLSRKSRTLTLYKNKVFPRK